MTASPSHPRVIRSEPTRTAPDPVGIGLLVLAVGCAVALVLTVPVTAANAVLLVPSLIATVYGARHLTKRKLRS